MSRPETHGPLELGGVTIPPGKRTEVELKVTRLPTGTWVSIQAIVSRGRRPGPCVWVSAAIHGDELNGVEIVRRVTPRISPAELRGTLITVPIVNALGFLHQDRCLPDRRDLNRCFPGSPRGSLGARMAHLFLSEIVSRCDYGIDLHTGSNHRVNVPQVRADLDNPQIERLTRAFGAPLAIHANTRDGSLRQVAADRGCPVLVYEAGETLRFDGDSIHLGVRGILRVLHRLGLLETAPAAEREATRFVRDTRWIRAPRGGILLLGVAPGALVSAGQALAHVGDAFSDKEHEIRAPFDGVVVGLTTNPLVNRGDAVVHLAAC